MPPAIYTIPPNLPLIREAFFVYISISVLIASSHLRSMPMAEFSDQSENGLV